MHSIESNQNFESCEVFFKWFGFMKKKLNVLSLCNDFIITISVMYHFQQTILKFRLLKPTFYSGIQK